MFETRQTQRRPSSNPLVSPLIARDDVKRTYAPAGEEVAQLKHDMALMSLFLETVVRRFSTVDEDGAVERDPSAKKEDEASATGKLIADEASDNTCLLPTATMLVYAALGLASAFMVLARTAMITIFGLRAAKYLFNQKTASLIRFFDANPIAHILTHYGSERVHGRCLSPTFFRIAVRSCVSSRCRRCHCCGGYTEERFTSSPSRLLVRTLRCILHSTSS